METAERIARHAFEGKFRRDGETPYVRHLERVVYSLRDESEDVRVVAWLHDLFELEDNTISVQQLADAGIPTRLLMCVHRLTRLAGVSYEEYIISVCQCAICRMVKTADILDNLTDKPTKAQRDRYVAAMFFVARSHVSAPAKPVLKRTMTYVRHALTGDLFGYTLDPREAVIAAYAQEQRDMSTWLYEHRYASKVAVTDGVYSCGHWQVVTKP